MKRWKLWTGIILVFILGMVAGSMGLYLLYGHDFRHFRHRDAATRNAETLERFKKELHLTDQQAAQVKTIIAQMEINRTEHFRKSRAELKTILESGFALMRLELTPEQQKLFDAYQEKLEKERKSRDRSR